MVVTTVSVLLALVFGSLAAYAIARFRLPFGLDRHIGLSLLVMRIVPPVVILIPVFLFILQAQPDRHAGSASSSPTPPSTSPIACG